MTSRIIYPLIALGALTALGGCAHNPPVELEQARSQLEQAKSTAAVSPDAVTVLEDAEETLQEAERVWDRSGNEDETRHLSYLVTRKVEVARLKADRHDAEQRLAFLRQAEEEARLQAETARARATAGVLASEAERLARERNYQRARANFLSEEVRDLRRELDTIALEETSRGLELTLTEVHFDLDQSTLNPGAYRSLLPVASYLKAHPERTVRIEGFADSTGDAQYNQRLSERRADAVREILLQNGVEAARIETIALGETTPQVSNETSAGRLQNRRVQIVIQ